MFYTFQFYKDRYKCEFLSFLTTVSSLFRIPEGEIQRRSNSSRNVGLTTAVPNSINPGDKSFTCPDCSKSFSQLSYLKSHMKVHTGEKPFSCSECSKSFSQLSTLKQHMVIHFGEKLYSCSACTKSYSYIGDCKKHVRVHIEETATVVRNVHK